MNLLEKKMIALLRKMKASYNVVEIKAEFEAEGTRLDEAIRLKEITDSAEFGLIIKIGGAEAVRDMLDAQLLDVSGLVAPMIESPYALEKFLYAIDTFFPEQLRKQIHFGINIETLQAYKNLDLIFKTPKNKILSRITVGRVDLSLSMGMSRSDVNHPSIYEITSTICLKAKRLGFETTVGGGIAIEAVPFLKRLAQNNVLDRYETRKVVFQVTGSFRKAADGILLANEFELLWLQNKQNYYGALYREDDKRINMLKKRLISGKKYQKQRYA